MVETINIKSRGLFQDIFQSGVFQIINESKRILAITRRANESISILAFRGTARSVARIVVETLNVTESLIRGIELKL